MAAVSVSFASPMHSSYSCRNYKHVMFEDNYPPGQGDCNSLKKLFETNFLGTFLCSRQAVKLMQKNKFGRIVNFSTVAVPLNLEGEAIYASSKCAVEQFTKIFAKEIAPFGITVNIIGPTPIQTDLIKAVPKIKIDELLNQQAIKRMGNFDDIINVVNFFIKNESNFITGQTIYLGGVFK